MAAGLFALLDDIAVIAKTAAASIDDVAAGAMKASAKSAGVLIDDAAISPQYVQGLTPARELPVIWKIARGSLLNKFLYIIPAAMLLTWLAPWALPILLIIGGSYLCFEGAEKVAEWVGLVKHYGHSAETENAANSEKKMVSGAVRTDLILSTEIMLISLANIEATGWIQQLATLAVVGLAMTALVYGVVGILVKMDDFGLLLAKRKLGAVKALGSGIVRVMPGVFQALSIVGTVAMLWVGGHILVTSLHEVGVGFFYDFFHSVTAHVAHLGGAAVWTLDTLMSAIGGVIYGGVLTAIILSLKKLRKTAH